MDRKTYSKTDRRQKDRLTNKQQKIHRKNRHKDKKFKDNKYIERKKDS